MGIEKEKADARIFMDEADFNMPMLTEKSRDTEQPDRDPHSLNSHLKLGFEDVIAEPETTHSFDKVWICSTAIYEISRYLIYKVLTVFLAIPLAFLFGLIFAILSCIHIWLAMPFVKTCLMVLPSVQAVFKSIADSFIAPLFASMGLSFSSVSVRINNS